MKSVVHITTWRPAGGLASVLKNIELNRNPNLFRYIYLYAEDGKDTEFDSFMRDRGNQIVVLPQLTFPIGMCRYMNAAYEFYKHNAKDIAIVHVHTPNIAIVHFFLAWKFGIKIRIAHSHNTRYSDNWWKGLLDRFFIWPMNLFLTDRFACGNDAARFLYGKHHLSDTYIFHNAIDTKNFQFRIDKRDIYRKKLNLTDKLVFGHAGLMVKRKNHMFLISTFAAIKEKYSDAILLLMGDGPLRANIQEKVEHLGLTDSVYFLGQRDDMADLLMAIDVFLFPSLFEGFPVSLVETQCVGLPCLVSDTVTREAAITDLIQFLPINDGAESLWVKAIENIKIDSRRDRSQELRAVGYDLSDEVKALENHYMELCQQAYAQ